MIPASTKQGGQTVAFPDVCKTPSPDGDEAVAYPDLGNVAQTVGESTNVKFAGKGVVTKRSEIPRSSGDEPGISGGVVSGGNMGLVRFKKGSSKVRVEGWPVQHLGAPTAQNGSNANMPFGSQVSPSQTKVKIGT